MRRPTIRLLLSDGTFCQYISAREAADLEARQLADRTRRISKKRSKSRGMAAAATYRLRPQPEPLRSIHEASPPSITSGDMLANVGITEGLGDVNRARVCLARQKIKFFDPGAEARA